MGRIKAIFFDFMNTLFRFRDNEKTLIGSFLEKVSEFVNKRLGINISTEELWDIFNKTVGFLETIRLSTLIDYPVEILVRTFTSRLGIFVEEDKKHIEDIYTTILADGVSPYSDVVGTLEYLKNSGYMVGLISNVQQYRFVETALKRNRLDTYFDAKVYSGIVGIRKPHPNIFKYAVNLLGIREDEAIMVGDSFVDDFYGAINAGLRPILLVRAEDKYRRYQTILRDESIIMSLEELKKIL